jgi:uncharacterized membrane protein (DUF485 family)
VFGSELDLKEMNEIWKDKLVSFSITNSSTHQVTNSMLQSLSGEVVSCVSGAELANHRPVQRTSENHFTVSHSILEVHVIIMFPLLLGYAICLRPTCLSSNTTYAYPIIFNRAACSAHVVCHFVPL